VTVEPIDVLNIRRPGAAHQHAYVLVVGRRSRQLTRTSVPPREGSPNAQEHLGSRS
jgi:hypothetical protein